jgi:hypothetical protein
MKNIIISAQEAYQALQAFVALSEVKLPVKAAYRISKITSKLRAEVVAVDEAKLELFKKYGVIQEDGSWKIEQANIEDFNTDISPLLKEDVDLGKVSMIVIDDLAGTTIEPAILEAVALFIVEEESA